MAVAADFYLSRNQAQKVLDFLMPHSDQDALLLRIVIAEQQLKLSSRTSQQRRADFAGPLKLGQQPW